ncbi:hypothetical protein H0H81_007920 [Sphagnurus paluster]|uniref:Mitochondrial import inner membrane translocase subunit TIM50 n=1 Tax=Sphagnurus paluster TaxID=117069 RepID=A0A9P7G1Z2_9AGAR|nr:hypothetical protein H0H81_007920 [Sphagnurus paluster]
MSVPAVWVPRVDAAIHREFALYSSLSDPPLSPSRQLFLVVVLDVQMNSLAYLSRQFDVLASAKTPPSTPTTERSSFNVTTLTNRLPKGAASEKLQRVSTWSTKSFLFPQDASPTPMGPKRSLSSPSFASLPKLASTPATASNHSPNLDTHPRSKPPVESIIRRIFFIRVFVLVWDNLRAVWLSLWDRETLRDQAISISSKVTHLEAETYPTEVKPPIPDAAPSTPSSTDASDTNEPAISSEKTLSEPLALSINPSALHTSTLVHPSESPLAISRSFTPLSVTRKTPFHMPKTLVLDLDETLIHSTSKAMQSSVAGGSGIFGLGSRNKGGSHTVELLLGGRITTYHVYKRPFVDFFLRTVSGWYTLVIFTASMQEYADPVIDWLDAGRGILAHRLFRDVTNGIPIEGWTDDPSDEALLDLLPVLDSLRFTSDVRRVLGLRSAGVLSQVLLHDLIT